MCSNPPPPVTSTIENQQSQISHPGIRLYRPSNGSEGMWFEAQFCGRCERDRRWRETDDAFFACRIHDFAIAWDTSDPNFPTEWRYDDAGRPVCTAFEAERDPARPGRPADPRTGNIFAD